MYIKNVKETTDDTAVIYNDASVSKWQCK